MVPGHVGDASPPISGGFFLDQIPRLQWVYFGHSKETPVLILSTALLLTPASLADVPPEDTSEEEEEGAEEQEGESEDTADDKEDDGCSTVAASASLLGVGAAAFMVGWRRED